MATDKSHNKSPVFKMGQTWHTLQDNLSNDEEETEEDDDLKDGNETMKLRREDMSLFGFCPAWDQFYLVVCEHCKQVIKPQALEKHIEIRHSFNNHISNSTLKSLKTRKSPITANGSDSNSINVNNKQLNKMTINNSSDDNLSDIKISVTCIDSVNNISDNLNTLSAIKRSPDHSNSVILSNSTNTSNSPLLSTLTTLTTLLEPTGPGPGSDFSALGVFNNLTPVTISSESSSTTTTSNKTNAKKKSSKRCTTSRKLLPCKDREYDANKHCGVHLQDTDKPCTRSLTCKTHSLTLRRAVDGRAKNFDELLTEHREAKEAALRAQGIEVKPTKKALLKQQRQQQLLLNQQIKTEPNHQFSIDYNRQQSSTTQSSDIDLNSHSIPTSFVNTNNLLTFATTPPSLLLNLNGSPPPQQQQQQLLLQQLQQTQPQAQPQQQSHHEYHTHENVLYMSSHPQPAAVCTFNIRSVPQCSRLLNRNLDLTIAALRSKFSNPSIVSKLNNTNLCLSSKLSSVHSVKSPLRTQSQTYPPSKKQCTVHTNTNTVNSFSYESSPQSSDPYNFPDATTVTATYTYIKPKTTIAKSTSNSATNKKRKKNDNNLPLDHSSLLSNGQLYHISVNKPLGTNSNSPKKSINKKSNNSHTNPNNSSASKANSTVNVDTNKEELYYPPVSLVNEVPNRHLNVSIKI